MKRTSKSIIALCIIGLAVLAIPPVQAATVSGTVVDDPFPLKRASMPLQGVKVVLWVPLMIMETTQSAAIQPGAVPGVVVDSTETDAQGKYALSSVAAGTYQMSFSKTGYNSRTIAAMVRADTTISVLLVAAGSKAIVAGSVWAACSSNMGMPCVMPPVSGCTVTVTGQTISSPVVTAPVQVAVYTTVTDAQGKYSFDSIPVAVNGERIAVSVRAKGFVSQSVDTMIRNTMTTTVNFILMASAGGLRDTVYVTPQKPTDRDSIKLLLFNAAHCCGTIYRDNTVTVSDTIIYLSYTYDDSLCPFVMCFAAGSSTNFSSKSLAAKRYSIYKVESPYCPPPRICPMYVTAPVLVGRITVTPAAAALPHQMRQAAQPENSLAVANGFVRFTLAKNATISLRAYDLRGSLIAEVFRGRLVAGTHAFTLSSLDRRASANRTVVAELSVDGKHASSTAVVVSK